jgi:hypothetical protein
MLRFLFLLLCFVFVFLSNLVFYTFKLILRRNGYRTSFWSITILDDMSEIQRLIKNEPDQKKKHEYKRLVFSQILFIFLLLASFIALLNFK